MNPRGGTTVAASALEIVFYAGDSNHDGVVNIGDFVVCGHSYGYSVGSPNYIPDCDLNRNGRGDTPDFILMGHNYQKRIS